MNLYEQQTGNRRKTWLIMLAFIGFLINAVGHAGLRLEQTAPGAWRRYVEIVLAGLAPQGRRKLTHKPPTSQQLRDSKKSS